MQHSLEVAAAARGAEARTAAVAEAHKSGLDAAAEVAGKVREERARDAARAEARAADERRRTDSALQLAAASHAKAEAAKRQAWALNPSRVPKP